MRILPAWLSGRDDHALAAKYAAKGRQSATDRARNRQTSRDTMRRPHRTARDADRAAQRWDDKPGRYTR